MNVRLLRICSKIDNFNAERRSPTLMSGFLQVFDWNMSSFSCDGDHSGAGAVFTLIYAAQGRELFNLKRFTI